MPREKDKLWEYISSVSKKTVQCSFCSIRYTGGVTRMRYHLAKVPCKDIKACTKVPQEVMDLALKQISDLEANKRKAADVSTQSAPAGSEMQPENDINHGQVTGLAQRTISSMVKKVECKEANKKIVLCIVNCNLPFHLLRSPDFKEAIRAVARAGPGYEPPSSELARTKLLAELKDDVTLYVQSIKESWSKSGVTIMSDSWTDSKNRPYLNLLASSPKGVVFLKSLCTVGNKKDALYIFKFISAVIDDIGAKNIVQFISDNASNYISAGRMIEETYPNIFRVNCSAHCLNLIFKEIDGIHGVSNVLESARKVVRFVYKHQHVTDLFRSKTDGRELKKPGVTRFATNFLCLQSVLKEEEALRYMVVSPEWRALAPCKSAEGIAAKAIIEQDSFWEYGRELLRVMEPLVRVLRLADGDGSLSGYIFYAIKLAKEGIKEFFHQEAENYLPFIEIVEDRYKKSLKCDLYAAAAYLNPHLFYDGLIKMDKEVKEGLENVVRKLVPLLEDQSAIMKELKDYHSLDTSIFSPMAINSLRVSHPRVWWDMWGGAVPILQKLAIKVLSQPTSSSACERNWSAFDAAHTKKRKRLEPVKLQDLVYVRMNNHFKSAMAAKERADSVPVDIAKINAYDGDFESAREENEEDSENEEDGISDDAGLGESTFNLDSLT